MSRVLALVTMLSLLAGCEGSPLHAPAPAASPSGPEPECMDEGRPCTVGVDGEAARTGTCRGGWCLPVGPGCTHDPDCDDGDACTVDRCEGGRCAQAEAAGACTSPAGASGRCDRGHCEVDTAPACTGDADCIAPANPCREARCSELGRCEVRDREEGAVCGTRSEAPGRCRVGRCALDAEAASVRPESCRQELRRGWYGLELARICRRGLKFALDGDELEEAREKIQKLLDEGVRYDMHIALVALPDGGYNIVTVNQRSRREVRGLVDPSFVAFTLASYTEKTPWRSRALQVWLEPYGDGWTIPTAGTRTAVRKGQAANALGFFGVVDVKAYRQWLESTFRPLPEPGARLRAAGVPAARTSTAP
jgi:hypothetical protein